MQVLLLLVSAGCSAPSAERAAPLAVGRIRGEPFEITRAWVFARDNDNLEWSVTLACAHGFPVDFGEDLGAVFVEVGGERRHPQGIGGDPSATYFEFGADRAGAEEWARLLGVTAKSRVDPRLRVTARMQVRSGVAAAWRALPLEFTVENHGTTPFTFPSSGAHAGPESEPRFEIRIERDGVVLPELAHAPWFGGLQRLVTLAPGETCSFEIDPAEWSNLDAPGSYAVHARCRLDIQSARTDAVDSYDHAHERWEEAASATCKFRAGS